MLSLIAAISENLVIGCDGDLPWSLPDDMRWFMKTTTGHAVIMGRRNFDSFDKPLPNRRNIVITRQKNYAREGIIVAHSLDEALAEVGDDDEPFIIGGQGIYALALPHVDRMYLTHVHATVQGDTCFPAFNPSNWQVTELSQHPADDRHAYRFTIKRYDRQ